MSSILHDLSGSGLYLKFHADRRKYANICELYYPGERNVYNAYLGVTVYKQQESRMKGLKFNYV